MSLPDFKNKTTVLLGAGVSNMPLAEYLVAAGAAVIARDKKTEAELGENGEKLRALGVRIIGGEGYLDGICGDYIFRSPGFRPDLPALQTAVENGAVLTSEMELFLENRPCTAIGITGSDGKTTTTTLISEILRHASADSDAQVFLGGNIGEPMLHRIDRMTERDFAVVELSSFQLMTVSRAPDVAVITNVTPNHLNWHTDMEEYVIAKAKILDGCARAVLNYENEITRRLAAEADCPVTLFAHDPIPEEVLRPEDSAIYERDGMIVFRLAGDEEEFPILSVSDILLPGRHNVENYMAAIAAVRGYADPDDIAAVARTFCGVRHRLERVHETGGVAYYNSSIDSSPTRPAAALGAMADRSLVLICGGYDKNIPFEPLADAIFAHGRIRAVVLTGATAEKIEDALRGHPAFAHRGFKLLKEPDFTKAVLAADGAAIPGDAVLLSPACASFDAFANFEKRGERFCEIVRGITR
ncbi:MAG: UDP-N-acetylmuramoyl-L-alanine--D-glutamate ligase [Clostridia bacterium]|nr:UDP-N-acetylmuramoyl-L-alanine--D-glutamate ligase [Clostridia bacterium]